MYQDDFNPADFETREAADKNVYVKFYIKPVQNEAKSAEEGRPIFDDREYIEIRTPGQQNNVVQRPVSDMDRKRFHRAYQLFKAGEVEQVVGTPLMEMPWITRSQVEELVHLRIRTVEALAELGDDVCSRFAGLYKLKQTAQRYVQHAKNNAPLIKFQEQLDELKNQCETYQRTIEEQSQIIQKLQQDLAAVNKG